MTGAPAARAASQQPRRVADRRPGLLAAGGGVHGGDGGLYRCRVVAGRPVLEVDHQQRRAFPEPDPVGESGQTVHLPVDFGYGSHPSRFAHPPVLPFRFPPAGSFCGSSRRARPDVRPPGSRIRRASLDPGVPPIRAYGRPPGPDRHRPRPAAPASGGPPSAWCAAAGLARRMMRYPSCSSRADGRMGVLPPSTRLATSGTPGNSAPHPAQLGFRPEGFHEEDVGRLRPDRSRPGRPPRPDPSRPGRRCGR